MSCYFLKDIQERKLLVYLKENLGWLCSDDFASICIKSIPSFLKNLNISK